MRIWLNAHAQMLPNYVNGIRRLNITKVEAGVIDKASDCVCGLLFFGFDWILEGF